MNLSKIVYIFIVLLINPSISVAQKSRKNKILAEEYYQNAIKFKNNARYDSAIVYFEKASRLYENQKLWEKYLKSETIRSSCYYELWYKDQALKIIRQALKKTLRYIRKDDDIIASAYEQLGFCYKDQINNDSTLFCWEKALQIRIKMYGEIHESVASCYNNLGSYYNGLNKNDIAIQQHLKSLEIQKELFGEGSIHTAKSYLNIGVVYINKKEYDLALEYSFKAANIIIDNYSDNYTLLGDCYNNIGFTYSLKKDYDLALHYYRKDLQITKKAFGENHPSVAINYTNIGKVYENLLEFELARQYYLKALTIRKKISGENEIDVLSNHRFMANIYRILGNYEFAIKHYFQALKIAEHLFVKDNKIIAGIYGDIGSVYRVMNEYDAALKYEQNSLNIKKTLLGEINSEVAKSYHRIGHLYKDKNELDLALDYYKMALRIKEDLDGHLHQTVADCYCDIGMLYHKKNSSLALIYYSKCLDILEQIDVNYDLDVAVYLTNLATLLVSTGNYEGALKQYSASLQISMSILGTNNLYVANNLFGIGQTYIKKAEYDLGLKNLFEALIIYKDLLGEKHGTIANCYVIIGDAYLQKYLFIGGQYDVALHYYQKAVAASLPNYNDTINYKLLPDVKEYLTWNGLLLALIAKAKVYEAEESDYNLALKHYQCSDTLITHVRSSYIVNSDKLSFGGLSSMVNTSAIGVCKKSIATIKMDSLDYFKNIAFYFSERNKSSVLLETLSGVEAKEFAGIPENLLKEANQKQKEIIQYKNLLKDEFNKEETTIIKNKLFKANRFYEELIDSFENQYPKYYYLKYNSKPVKINEIQQVIDRKTAIISYLTIKNDIAIFTITKDSFDLKFVPISKKFIDSVQIFRRSLLFPNSLKFNTIFKEYAYEFYCKLLPENLNEKIENLVIIPDVNLSIIPFESFLTEVPKEKEWQELQYLLKRYNISYSYSVSLFYKILQKKSKFKIENKDLDDWLALAPVFDVYDSSNLNIKTRELLLNLDSILVDLKEYRGMLFNNNYISPLPETEREVKVISDLFKKNDKIALTQIRKNATEEYVKSGELGKFKIIHFATHGFVNTTNPELSGILLAQDASNKEDGILYLDEMFNLTLNADLTVLSACETGLGKIQKGEGLIGLSRALLYAGSKNIIVSLWKVADDSTSELMIKFYKKILETKTKNQEFSEALRKAKLEIIDEEKFSHPFYWSPFILIGK